MPYANGKIYRTATEGVVNDLIGDIQQALGTTETDLGNLCRHANINKWAKYKPVRYYTMVNGVKTPFTETLTGDMCKGAIPEINAGYVYGLKMAGSATDYRSLHDLTFEYRMPRGIDEAEMFRTLDFDGYDRNAVPNLSGSIEQVGFYDTDIKTMASAFYNPNNTTGIDYASILNSTSEIGETGIKHSYPCVLVSDVNKTRFYMCALKNDNTDTVTPLFYNNAWQQFFYAKFNQSNFPLRGGCISTMFLTRKVANETYLNGEWYEITEASIMYSPAYVLPDSVAQPINIQKYETAAKPVFLGVSATRLNGIALSYTLNPMPPEESTDVEFEFTFNGMTGRVSGTVTRFAINLVIPWSAFPGYLPISGTTIYNGVTVIRTRKSGATTWAESVRHTDTFTIE